MDNGASSYRRFLDGDDDGIVEMIREYKDGLMLYLNNYVQNIHTAEDLMEDTFVRIAIKKPRFFGKSSLKTWLYSIGRNIAVDYLRKQSKTSSVLSDEEYQLINDEEDAERLYIRDERKLTVHKTLKKLNSDYRKVLYLIYFEEFSIKETAYIMKKTYKQAETEIIYPWKYRTATEKYNSVTICGIEYTAWSANPLSEAMIGEYIGNFEVFGYDDYEEKKHSAFFEVCKINNIFSDYRVAVKLDGDYYVFGRASQTVFSNFGEVWDAYGLDKNIELCGFTFFRSASDYDYRRLTDSVRLWQLLSECRTATPNGNDDITPSDTMPTETLPCDEDIIPGYDAGLPHSNDQDFSGIEHISFSSDAFGAYKQSLGIYKNGFLSIIIDGHKYSFYIGKEKADEIIGYSMSYSEKAEKEPNEYWLVGKLTEVCGDHVLIDDTSLCADKKEGRVYKLMTEDIRIRRCFEFAGSEIDVGDIVVIKFSEPIKAADGNVLRGAVDAQIAYVDGDGNAIVFE